MNKNLLMSSILFYTALFVHLVVAIVVLLNWKNDLLVFVWACTLSLIPIIYYMAYFKKEYKKNEKW